MTVFTIGHSTRPTDEFLKLLTAHGVRRLVDVRKIPESRRIDMREITSTTDVRPHALTPWARVEGTRVTYPGLPLTS